MNESEIKYRELLFGRCCRFNKLGLQEIVLLMNNELNINSLLIQKSGKDTFYVKVDEPTIEYYRQFDNVDRNVV